MESRILGLAQQTMENMAHLMEKRHDIAVSHQSRFLRSGFRQIGNHHRQRIVACIVWKLITIQETPNSSIRIFPLYLILSESTELIRKMHTAREQIQVAISDEARGIFDIFLPNRKRLDIFSCSYEKSYLR